MQRSRSNAVEFNRVLGITQTCARLLADEVHMKVFFSFLFRGREPFFQVCLLSQLETFSRRPYVSDPEICQHHFIRKPRRNPSLDWLNDLLLTNQFRSLISVV